MDGLVHIFWKDPEKHCECPQFEPDMAWAMDIANPLDTVTIPWGSPVILLSIEQNPKLKSKSQKIIRIMYDNMWLVAELSDTQINKYFCTPGVWKKRYAKILNNNKD